MSLRDNQNPDIAAVLKDAYCIDRWIMRFLMVSSSNFPPAHRSPQHLEVLMNGAV